MVFFALLCYNDLSKNRKVDAKMDYQKWAQEVAQKIKIKELEVAKRNRGKIPYTAENGAWNDCSGEKIGWWTNGFWGGMMWQLYKATGEEIYRENAEETEEKLDAALNNYWVMDHDSGFRWLPTSVAKYRLTGDKKSENRALMAASNLAGRFNPAGNFIVAWNGNVDPRRNGWAIIDCTMNLPLLYWAYDQTGDPRYYHIATKHADTAIKAFIREDGSARHIVEFDPVTGDINRSYGGQGYAKGSSWTRGQSWALYGFTLSFLHTKKERYLDTAEKVADYFISCIPESGLIPVDFRQPSDCSWEDDIAASVAACGLIELSKVAKEWKKKTYLDAAVRMLKALDEKSCSYDIKTDYLLERCTAAYGDEKHNFPIVYCDYYYIEAIWKLTGEELFIW